MFFCPKETVNALEMRYIRKIWAKKGEKSEIMPIEGKKSRSIEKKKSRSIEKKKSRSIKQKTYKAMK